MWDFPLFPEQASTAARHVDQVYFALIALSIFFIFSIGGAALYFMTHYHFRRDADRRNVPKSNWKLEVIFIGSAVVVSTFFFFWGAYKYLKISQATDDALELFVLGKQWMWKVQYPEGQREINRLHIPVNQPIMLRLTSQDVIHSFYVPAFRVKQDVVPGRYTTLWFEATKTGTFKLECAEYCGTDHSRMLGEVVVMSAPDFARWLANRPVQSTMVAQGERIFARAGCSGCHTAASAVHAPDLQGLFGRRVALSTGETLVADASYIRDSILLPKKHVVAGYAPIMPSFEGQLSEQEIFALLEFIKFEPALNDAANASPNTEKNDANK